MPTVKPESMRSFLAAAAGTAGNVVLCTMAYSLLALAVTLKESAFARFRREAAQRGQQSPGAQPELDICVLSAAAAAGQLATQLLAAPGVLAATGGGMGGAVLREFGSGAQALAGRAQPAAPWLALVYWGCNVGFSLSALQLVRTTSAATVVLANVVALPLSALAFCLPLPLLGRAGFDHWMLVSLAIIVTGNLLYGHKGLRSWGR
ncbi:unnamed protein product [Prorocentrum cordatum]|uniref:EamA domain-containing protein n=1 Tax=Prorocentrum cordatum TaxID=2364126 RepID=A0ABN9T1Q0_9DINO|nr:unnamed protein product [Polarella glacialis]